MRSEASRTLSGQDLKMEMFQVLGKFFEVFLESKMENFQDSKMESSKMLDDV